MARKISVEIVGDARSLEKAFAKSSKSARGFQGDMQKTGRRGSSVFRGMGRAIGLATGALGVAGFAGAAHAAFEEMAEAQKVTAQTNAVLKSTGKAANVSAKQVDTMAESLMQLSGTDDEEIKSGENLLLTFTNIRNELGKGNDIFNQATRTMLDMSVALGQDTKQSAIQLGKALQDPIKGVSALRRVGVNFTDAQKDQIKQLVKTGHTLQAQKIILRELQREFGGSARAAGKTLPGQLNILRNTLLNLGGTIAQTLSPTIQRLVGQLTKWLNNSKNQKQILDTVNSTVSALSIVVGGLADAFKVLNAITGSARNTILLLIGAYVTFKSLKMIGYVAKLAKTFRSLAAAEGAAAAAGAGGGIGGGGRAGRVGRLGRIGRALPLVGTGIALSQLPHPKVLDQSGISLARKGIGRVFGTHVEHQTIHVHGVQNARQLEHELTKRHAGRPHRRRGAR